VSARGKGKVRSSKDARSRTKGNARLVEELAARQKHAESAARQEAARVRGLEKKLAALLARTAQKQPGNGRPRGLINLRASTVVNLEDWEKKIEEKYSLLCAKERDLEGLEEKIHGEIEKLLTEIKQRDLLLATREVEIKSLKHGLWSRLDELESQVTRHSSGKKAARFVSFLVDIGKKH
jgi:hypothetical protein